MNKEAVKSLAAAIVLQAVEDWRALCVSRTATNSDFNELRMFFRSDYCQLLCDKVNPITILEKLETEKNEIRNNGRN